MVTIIETFVTTNEQRRGFRLQQKQQKQQNAQVITALGGPSAVSRLVNLTPQAVSMWKSRGIPEGWRFFLEQHLSKLQPELEDKTCQTQ